MIIRELCLENFTKIPQALQAGVERIELCDNLAVGGTTPSYGVIEEAAKYVAESKTTLAVMIRPRGGNFVYNSHEIIETDTLKAVEAGAQNIVFGALTPGNEIDTDALETVSIAAQGLPITFHMAFDEVTDQEKAIDQLVEFGVDKILTHGGPLDQPLNTDKLKSLIDYAKGKINIIIGGGVNAENFENLAQLTGTNYVHGTKIIKL